MKLYSSNVKLKQRGKSKDFTQVEIILTKNKLELKADKEKESKNILTEDSETIRMSWGRPYYIRLLLENGEKCIKNTTWSVPEITGYS